MKNLKELDLKKNKITSKAARCDPSEAALLQNLFLRIGARELAQYQTAGYFCPPQNAHVAELVDALRSGRSVFTDMGVRVPPWVQKAGSAGFFSVREEEKERSEFDDERNF
jgi:hypothetical protein